MIPRRQRKQPRQRRKTAPAKLKHLRLRKQSGPIEYRGLAISEVELDLLLAIDEQLGLPDSLRNRMLELKADFVSYLEKLAEVTKRAKSNSFWIELERIEQERINDRVRADRAGRAYAEIYPEPAHLTSKQLRRLLEKEKLSGILGKKRGANRNRKGANNSS